MGLVFRDRRYGDKIKTNLAEFQRRLRETEGEATGVQRKRLYRDAARDLRPIFVGRGEKSRCAGEAVVQVKDPRFERWDCTYNNSNDLAWRGVNEASGRKSKANGPCVRAGNPPGA